MSLSILSHAREVSLMGRAPGAEGKELRIYCLDDQVSSRMKKLGQTQIASSGTFEIGFSLTSLSKIFIYIDFHRTELLVEPGNQYEIQVENFNAAGFKEEINPYLDPPYMHLTISKTTALTSPLCYDSLNAKSDRYIFEHAKFLTRAGSNHLVDTLISQWQQEIPCQTAFMEAAIRYRVAQLSISRGRRNQAQVFNQYISGMPVLQNHPDYMAFFSQLFDKHLLTSRILPFFEIQGIINGRLGYAKLLDFLGRDTLLRQAIIRELVILVNMRDLYYHPDIQSDAMLEILREMSTKASEPIHRHIANNLIFELQHLSPGTLAPDFSLPGMKNEPVSLSKAKGKYLYVQFFTSWCVDCVTDMMLIDKLRKEFGDTIQFLSISVDLEPARLYAFLQRHRYPWDFVHFNQDYDLINAYRLRTYPTYILIDPRGNILASPALSPSAGVAVYFSRMLSPLRKP